MKCPYTVNMLVVEQNTNEFTTDGQCASYQTVTRTTREYLDCLKEECGAYKNGECHYKKDQGFTDNAKEK